MSLTGWDPWDFDVRHHGGPHEPTAAERAAGAAPGRTRGSLHGDGDPFASPGEQTDLPPYYERSPYEQAPLFRARPRMVDLVERLIAAVPRWAVVRAGLWIVATVVVTAVACVGGSVDRQRREESVLRPPEPAGNARVDEHGVVDVIAVTSGVGDGPAVEPMLDVSPAWPTDIPLGPSGSDGAAVRETGSTFEL